MQLTFGNENMKTKGWGMERREKIRIWFIPRLSLISLPFADQPSQAAQATDHKHSPIFANFTIRAAQEWRQYSYNTPTVI